MRRDFDLCQHLRIFVADKPIVSLTYTQVYMKKLLAIAALALCALVANAQEKTMRVHKTDGTCALTRVAELTKISFMSIDDPGKGLIVVTSGSDPVAMLFEQQPEITVGDGKLIVTSKSAADNVEVELDNVNEIKFGVPASLSTPGTDTGIVCVLQPGAAVFKFIPDGAVVEICRIDGSAVPVCSITDGELKLSGDTLGAGIYIVRIGTFTAKVTL